MGRVAGSRSDRSSLGRCRSTRIHERKQTGWGRNQSWLDTISIDQRHCADHKTQWLTLDHLMLGQTPKINTAITDSFTSFSHASDGLHLLTPLSSDLSKYIKRNDITAELQRLHCHFMELRSRMFVRPMSPEMEPFNVYLTMYKFLWKAIGK